MISKEKVLSSRVPASAQGGCGMRLAYVSDQKFFSWEGRWFTTASFPLDEMQRLFQFVKEWVIYGRLYQLVERPTNMYEIPSPGDALVVFQGPRNMRGGTIGYMIGALGYFLGARRTIAASDIVWLKLPFVAPLAYLTVPPKRSRIVFCQLVGDPETAAAKREFSVRVLSQVYRYMVRWIIHKCNYSIFVSQHLMRKYSCRQTPALVANESRITDEMFAPNRNYSPHSITRILFVGRLSPEKGITTLFAALSSLKDKIQFETWIVGSGDQLSELTNLAEQLGIKTKLRFLGQVPWGGRLFSIMREADVLVLPSTSEGLPLVLVEAMSQGLPVVATAVGGIPEIIENRVSGLLVPQNSPNDLARAIIEVISDRQLREKIITNGFEVARRNTFRKQTGKIAQAVQQLIDTADCHGKCEIWRSGQ